MSVDMPPRWRQWVGVAWVQLPARSVRRIFRRIARACTCEPKPCMNSRSQRADGTRAFLPLVLRHGRRIWSKTPGMCNFRSCCKKCGRRLASRRKPSKPSIVFRQTLLQHPRLVQPNLPMTKEKMLALMAVPFPWTINVWIWPECRMTGSNRGTAGPPNEVLNVLFIRNFFSPIAVQIVVQRLCTGRFGPATLALLPLLGALA